LAIARHIVGGRLVTDSRIEPVVAHAELPAGVLGPNAVPIEVRCFLVTSDDRLVLVDAGVPGTADAIEETLRRIGRRWADISDVVLTHAHFDHVGGLGDVAARAATATIWAGALDAAAIGEHGPAVRSVAEGDRIGELQVLDTPGHTPGHISLLHEGEGTVLVGDLIGSVDGNLSLGPPAFTADAERSRQGLERVVNLGAQRLLFSHGAEIADPNERIRAFLTSSDVNR
jgi:glyoxylase-like metal-dependent hydrolase (beta-lactamase superfamily II)